MFFEVKVMRMQQKRRIVIGLVDLYGFIKLKVGHQCLMSL